MSFWQVAGSGGFLDLETTFGYKITQMPGMGMAPLNNISSTYGLLDGALYQRTRTEAKQFTLIGTLRGSTIPDLHAKRRNLISAIAPDRNGSPGQPVLLRYSGGACTLQASAFYRSGMELGNVRARTEANISFTFEQFDPYWEKTTNSSAALTVQSTFTASYIAQRAACGTWGAVGTGTNGEVKVLTSGSDGTLYAGGAFTTAGGGTACRIAKFSTARVWSSVGNAFNDTCNDIVIHPNGVLYAMGSFTLASATAASRVAQWSGTAWANLGNAVNGTVNSGTLSKTGDLYISGSFTTASGFSACRVARWNIDRWRSVGAGVNAEVKKIVFDGASELYAIGAFTTACATGACGVARFNLTDWWRPLGTGGLRAAAGVGLGLAGIVLPNGNLFIGGNFDQADATSACYAVQWNGAGYNSVSNHVNDDINGLWPLYNNAGLVVSGVFTLLGGLVIARNKGYWNGSAWLPFDIELPGQDDISSAYSASTGELTLGFGNGGTASAAGVTAITNTGTAATYPILTASAPTSLVADGEGLMRLTQLINYTTGDAIYFNLSMVAGEVVTLDLRPNRKTFTSNFRGNIINAILPGSNLTTWKLLAGVNNISTWLTGGSGAVTLSWTDRFWSVDN